MQYSYKTEFGKRHDAYDQSREMEIYRNLKALQSSFQVFETNFHELIGCLEPLTDARESLSVYNQQKMENVDALIAKTKRLLHNFLASAKSLVDHTRVIVNRLYERHQFLGEYQSKVKQDLAQKPVQKFVQHLRNYTQHYTLPILALQINFSDDLNFNVKMDVNLLKKWDGWGSSKSYLETVGDDFCIVALASEYYALIYDFYDWLINRQQELHQTDFENLRKMEEELMIMEEQIINSGARAKNSGAAD